MATNIEQQINAFITQHNLIPAGSSLILGLSGGPDSVFLLHILAQMHAQGTISLVAAHLDHEWRADSGNDVTFCKKITAQYNVPLVTAKASELTLHVKPNGSQEEVGRIMRRYFLQQVRTQHNADYIALAHHAQDQQETFFIRLIRGTSLAGLTAMQPRDGVYIRPLLEVNKPDILAYIQQHAIDYLVDPSNESPAFLRNRIRNTVLPALQACDERFDANFLATLKRLQQTEDFLQQQTAATFATLSNIEDDQIHINSEQLLALHPVMQYRIVMHWLIASGVPFYPTQAFLHELLRFLSQPGSKTHTIHTTWAVHKKKQWAHITKT